MATKKRIQKTCQRCGKIFEVWLSQGARIFCSKECVQVRMFLICRHCGIHFSKAPTRIKRGRGLYCSWECRWDAYRKRYRDNLSERFEAQIDKSGFCWEWTGPSAAGYGSMRVNGKKEFAHRLAYRLFIGEIPEGMVILHKCDNPKCVRPEHLQLGTFKDNSEDMVAKRRQAYGERQHDAKLTTAQVIDIRQRFAQGNITKTQLGRDFGVSRQDIREIINGHIWRYAYESKSIEHTDLPS